MQFVLVIYHGTTPGTPAWKSLSHEEQKEAYANYEALNQMANLMPAPPLGLPENATTVRVENGSTVTPEGPYFGAENAVGGYAVRNRIELRAALFYPMKSYRDAAARNAQSLEAPSCAPRPIR